MDRRKQSDGLWALASQHLGLDPKGGALFVFTNKSRGRIKLLHWDGSGVWVLAKRLEQGGFTGTKTATGDTRKLTLEPEALTMLLAGIDLKNGAKKGGYEGGLLGARPAQVCRSAGRGSAGRAGCLELIGRLYRLERAWDEADAPA